MKFVKRKTVKAQIQMGESILVLILFLFLLVFGVVVYAKFQTLSMKNEVTERQDLLSEAVARKIRLLPEFQCTIAGTAQFDCYDMMKLKAFTALVADQKYRFYYDALVFKGARVVITPVTLSSAIDESFMLYGVEQPNAVAATPYRAPVLLYDPLTETKSFGYLTIEVYR